MHRKGANVALAREIPGALCVIKLLLLWRMQIKWHVVRMYMYMYMHI